MLPSRRSRRPFRWRVFNLHQEASSPSSTAAAALTRAWLFISCTRSTLTPIYTRSALCARYYLTVQRTGLTLFPSRGDGEERERRKSRREREKGKKKSTKLGLNGGKTGNYLLSRPVNSFSLSLSRAHYVLIITHRAITGLRFLTERFTALRESMNLLRR